MRLERARDWGGALTAVSGGMVVLTGAVLPWLSLFAGLQRYSGMAGLYGRVAFAGGALSVGGGLLILVRPDRRLRAAIGGLGAVLTLFACWVLLGLRDTTRELGRHPLLLARPGPGLFVVLTGALVVAALLLPSGRRVKQCS
jgi:hypothetical protein